MQYPIIHIVKRFGRVGGMESYVWHLVHGLAKRDLSVVVVCEQLCEMPSARIRVIEVIGAPERPRWKSMMTFRIRVDQAIRNNFQGQFVIVHSHERSICHQVTTFHGPPFTSPKNLYWLSRFNQRLNAWKLMEHDELLGPHVQMVLAVSSKVRDELLRRYTAVEDQKVIVAWPGVMSRVSDVREIKRKDLHEVRFVFVGKEWKRKGLDIAVRIVQEFRKHHPGATLTVFGAEHNELPRSIRSLQWIEVSGWLANIPWADFSILLLPAREEPFGMVVAEARAHGLSVLMSSKVGATDLGLSSTSILNLDSPVDHWSKAAVYLAVTADNSSEIRWTWSDLVTQHSESIYPQLEAVQVYES